MDTVHYSKITELLQQWIKDFSGIFISPAEDEWYWFFGQDLTNVDFSNSTINDPKFNSTILIETSFYNTTFYIKEKDITSVFKNIKIIKDVDFRGAQFKLYSDNDFSMTYPLEIEKLLAPEEYGNVIKTDEEYQKFLERKNQEQKTQLESTTEKQTNSLVEWFEKLEKEYYFEERMWLRITAIVMFFLIFLLFLPVIFQFYSYSNIVLFPTIFFLFLYIYLIQQIQDPIEIKPIGKIERSLPVVVPIIVGLLMFYGKIPNIPIQNIEINFHKSWIFIPIILFFATLLYFSVTQYSKSKKLRIDNQNKIALIHGMMAIKADTTNMDKWRFYDKIADIVFDRVHHEKEENLPLDKIIQLIKAINPKNPQ